MASKGHPFLRLNPHIFRRNDIRGHADDDLHDTAVEIIGESLAVMIQDAYGNGITLTVGRDMRVHSPRIACYFSQATMEEVIGNIMVTGSHNPPEFNGLKITLNGRAVIEDLIQDLREKAYEALSFPFDTDTGTYKQVEIIPSYLDYLAGNGTAGLVLPEILDRLGFRYRCLYCEPDGSFPNHHPDPTVEENLADLKKAVKADKAHLGVAYDGDADRLGVVDNRGRIIWGDQLLIMYAAEILKKHPDAAIVADVKCSQTLFEAIKGMGGRAIMWKTGHSLIKRKMKEEEALLAGEMSGHLFFAHRYFGYDDAIYATLRLLELMAVKGQIIQDYHFSEVADFLPSICNTPELRYDCPDEIKFSLVDRLRERLFSCREGNGESPTIHDIITIDGVRVIFTGGWALIRASNTQPVLVLRFEAENKKTLTLLQRFIMHQVKQVRREIQPSP